jgi:hypothetical protein
MRSNEKMRKSSNRHNLRHLSTYRRDKNIIINGSHSSIEGFEAAK